MSLHFIFFGTPQLSADVLEHLKLQGLVPSLVVTNPDRPQGRKMLLTPPPVKLWAQENRVPFLQPEKLDSVFNSQLTTYNPQLFVVVAYGKIIPKKVLDIPEKGTLNLHYSLLPKYRGASPIESAILNDDKEVGVSIMLMDEKMDHGPIISNQKLNIKNQKWEWPPKAGELRIACNELGAELLAETIPLWVAGKIRAKEQNHSKATYTEKIKKEDGLIRLDEDAYKNFLKIRAYSEWPRAYFFAERKEKKVRVTVTDAEFKGGELVITRVVPEGKKEMLYTAFLHGLS